MPQSELHLGSVHGSVVKLLRDLGLQSSSSPTLTLLGIELMFSAFLLWLWLSFPTQFPAVKIVG